MEKDSQGRHWRNWSHWLLWWKIDPDELQRQVERYEGLGMIGSVRCLGFLISIAVGVAVAGMTVWFHMPSVDYSELAEAMAFGVLGCLVLWGKSWASLGLMVLFTIDRVLGNLRAFTYHDSYYVNHLAFWLCEGLLAWTIWMHVFYSAYRIEQQRARGGRLVTPGTGEPPSGSK